MKSLVRALSPKRDRTRSRTVIVLDVKARHRPWSREWRVIYALRYGEMPLRAWWRRMTACPDCHGTGVIMTDCPGDMNTCVWPCPVMTDQGTAARIWSWWLA